MGPLLASLLPAGINALGSLLGGGGESETGVNFRKLRRDAKRAGFNPLTALMATGGAGYQAPSAPALSSAEFIASTLADGVAGYFQTQREDMLLAQARDDEARLRSEYRAAMAMPSSSFGPGLTLDQSDPAYAGITGPGTVEVLPPSGGMQMDWTPGYRDTVQPNGSMTRVPVGPDAGEVVSGIAIKSYTDFRDGLSQIGSAFLDRAPGVLLSFPPLRLPGAFRALPSQGSYSDQPGISSDPMGFW